jgi:putative addiction module killer protein
MKAFKIREYSPNLGPTPYRAWLDSLDLKMRARIQARVLRFETGLFGDWKAVGDGVHEARLDFGPGYRIYFGIEGSTLVILLLGGDKASQRRDISKAKGFWSDYKGARNDKKK